ncbi:NAD(P)/FAD-dependent oxidoreductase [Candidatus Bipolaricaulota bacterium]|nr:NAD(P)/FAD-dependent oxidoreductase [Candidatus Bipolaricaulota bacterium]
MYPDVAIVGAGPIGLATARAAAEAGARVLVVEKKPEGGASSCCTGLVSPGTLSVLGTTSQCVLQEIRALRIHLPSGRQIELRSNRLKAVTIDRLKLEQELLRNARTAGAEVHYCTDATGARAKTLDVRSSDGDLQFHPAVIIGADGPHSRVATWFSFEQPSQFAAAIQVELDAVAGTRDWVDVFVGRGVAPGFFGWSVPAEKGILRVGLGVLPPHTPEEYLNRLLTKHYPATHIRSRSAGWIPLAPVSAPAKSGVLLVGDAAGQTKPLSGGGLYTGGLCARIGGETAARIAQSPENDDVPDSYASRCRDAIGKEQAFGRSMSDHLSRLSDADIESIAAVLDDPSLLQFMADEADIDGFHRLPDQLASEPRLWSALLRIIPLLGSL